MMLKFYSEREFFSNRIALHIAVQEKGSTAIAAPLVMKVSEDEAVRTEPCMRLTIDEAHALMDELWHAGIRPSEGMGSAGAMAATQKHLEDMRTLVFKPVKS